MPSNISILTCCLFFQLPYSIPKNPKDIPGNLTQHHMLKPESICVPMQCIGRQAGKYVNSFWTRQITMNGKCPRKSTPSTKEAIKDANDWFKGQSRLSKPVHLGFCHPGIYRKRMPLASVLTKKNISITNNKKIEVVRCMAKLGRIDITWDVAMPAS